MGNDKGFRKINELVAALADSERALKAGTLGLEGLESACSNARQLYERLVVLRHKAREVALRPVPGKEPVASPPVQPPKQPAEAKPIRLDTRPPESLQRQTSLIDAIEAEEPPTNPKKDQAKPSQQGRKVEDTDGPARTSGSTLAEKMERASVSDFDKVISLSHKFWFVAELFNGDRITYEKSIDKLNGLKDLREAQAFVAEEVVAKLKKPADPEALATFEELVQRRFA